MSFKEYLKEFGNFNKPLINSQFKDDVILQMMEIIDDELLRQSKEDSTEASTELIAKLIYNKVIVNILKNLGR